MKIFILFFLFAISLTAISQTTDSLLPVRGFCISAPRPEEVPRFLKFISDELVTRKINTLVLRVDFNYQYSSHPELQDSNALSKEQVKQLSDEGHVIGSHTWDHHNVKKYTGEDWITQVEKPSKQLESIIGKPIEYFAYPFGLWNHEAIPELKKRGMIAAFQLYSKRDEQDPLYTIRRIIVPAMKPASLYKSMHEGFHYN